MVRRHIVFVLLCMILVRCERPKTEIPQGILSPQQMVPVLADVHIAQAALNVFPAADTVRYNMSDYLTHILASHKIEKAVYDSSVSFYTLHPEILHEIYDDVITELSRRQGEVSGK